MFQGQVPPCLKPIFGFEEAVAHTGGSDSFDIGNLPKHVLPPTDKPPHRYPSRKPMPGINRPTNELWNSISNMPYLLSNQLSQL
jgi:hypothetical protein